MKAKCSENLISSKEQVMAVSEAIQTLQTRLPSLDWVTSPIQVKRLSKDFHWFSPILFAQLNTKKADIVVRPKNEKELKEVVAQCAALKLPMTVRGGGTGNYGQSVPLQGGVTIDTSHYNQINWLSPDDGIVSVQSGIKLGALEDAARDQGWELRCMPSTYKMASIGGLFSGGFGGVGSINYGPVAAEGTILSVRVMTISETPDIFEVGGDELTSFHHTYGTNGIILDIELALAPARVWDEYLLSFKQLDDAIQFSKQVANSTGIDKRNIAVFDAYSASHFEQTPKELAASDYVVIAVIASNAKRPMLKLMENAQGKIEWSQTFQEALQSKSTLMECCWNHSTLHALKNNKALTYLQTNYDVDNVVEQLTQIDEASNSQAQVHLEVIRMADSELAIVGLPLIHFQSAEQLQNIVDIHTQFGVSINDPHVYTLEDGKHKGCFSHSILDSKRKNDPLNLLNVGKLRSL
jgi:hypothetical protein